MSRRIRTSALAFSAFLLFTILYFSLSGGSSDASQAELLDAAAPGQARAPAAPIFGQNSDVSSQFALPPGVLDGGAIAPKLENKTVKQELGRASWRLLHTMMARFPEEPTNEESLALQTYIQLFARLYPCGDCAAHFQKLLQKYPPQTSSRNAAAGWACFMHNEVNQRLRKEIFDCTRIGDFYDCGCGEEKDGSGASTKSATSENAKGGGVVKPPHR